jgi:hypothetical protein
MKRTVIGIQDGTATVGITVQAKNTNYFTTTPFAISFSPNVPVEVGISQLAGIIQKNQVVQTAFTYNPYAMTTGHYNAKYKIYYGPVGDDALWNYLEGSYTVDVGVPTNITLQDGLNGYAGTEDATIRGTAGYQNTNYGNLSAIAINSTDWRALSKFKIFQSEGGPIPNTAFVTSATLSYDAYSTSNTSTYTYTLYPVARLWTEGTTTWNNATTGVPWGQPGASQIGTDIHSSPIASVNWAYNYLNPWISVNVTPAVLDFNLGYKTNYGWRITNTSSTPLQFYSSEASQSLRPKMTIDYLASIPGLPKEYFKPDTSIATALVPNQTALSMWPNPCNPQTTMSFALPVAGSVNIKIFDLRGRLVKTLVDNYRFTEGMHHLSWPGLDGNNKQLSSGTYFVRLMTADKVILKKLLYLR